MASFGICRRTGQATSGSLSEEKSVWIDVQLGKTGTRWAAVIKDENGPMEKAQSATAAVGSDSWWLMRRCIEFRV